ncbi:Acylphosphate phosphohydrolase, putative [hydrothermal vent metagenome]|uniref:Acylphosphate phosphohydrolase, putative n=1 Tax=hydrothermal vent metagenome TaxID=652676 RepID=A0A3B1DIN8_9ZZZZ
MEIKAVHIVVRGRVQGVWFRGSAQSFACELGLTGWAKNCPDGTVEIHAEGAGVKLNEFIKWCETGPPLADVTGVDVTPVPAKEMEKFFVR